jgi:hypothetical protein
LSKNTKIRKEANELSRKLFDVLSGNEIEDVVVILAMQFFTVRVLSGDIFTDEEVKGIYLQAYEIYEENKYQFDSNEE